MLYRPLIQFVYNNASDDIVSRGKKIYASGKIEVLQKNTTDANVSFRVKDEVFETWYTVQILDFADVDLLQTKCSCAYKQGVFCKHAVGAIFYLQDLVDCFDAHGGRQTYNQSNSLLKLKNIDVKWIEKLVPADIFNQAEAYLQQQEACINEAEKGQVWATLKMSRKKYDVRIVQNYENNFDTSCSCMAKTDYPLCVHKCIVLLQLYKAHGAYFFDSIKNYDIQKSKLLSLYGYTLQDNWEEKFSFSYKDGKPYLRVLDSSVQKITTSATPKTSIESKVFFRIASEVEQQNKEKKQVKIGVVLQPCDQQFPFVQLVAIKGITDEDNTSFVGEIEVVDFAKQQHLAYLDAEDVQTIQMLKKMSFVELHKHVNKNSIFGDIWQDVIVTDGTELAEETKQLMLAYLLPKYKKLFDHTAQSYLTFYHEQGTIKKNQLQLVYFSVNYVKPFFKVVVEKDIYHLECYVQTPLEDYLLSENESKSCLVFQVENQIFLWKNYEDVLAIAPFLPTGKRSFPADEWSLALEQIILPLSKNYKVDFSQIPINDIKNIEPNYHILLKEKGNYLLLEPQFVYQNYIVQPTDADKIMTYHNQMLQVVHRNKQAEEAFIQKIATWHSAFQRVENPSGLLLKSTEVLKNNWFYLFLERAREENFTLSGFEDLRKFNFNKNKISTQIFVSSHTDWFDAKVEVAFGDQKVTIEEVKKALATNQTTIALSDGTMGVISEEWREKYALLFQMGDVHQHQLKLPHTYFSLIDELYKKREELQIHFELEEKFKTIREKYTIHQVLPSESLQKILRPYQLFGFNWINFLNEVKWGGILADDMGLGKTVQVLSFLQYLQSKNKEIKILVVCPTSLMYNWENEIKKFAPELKYHIHHGTGRDKALLHDKTTQVFITTYGTVRSDILTLTNTHFNYVVLDESQAIKNPTSKIAKAVSLLQADNRLCLSGTPLQNNTFDIFTQINFLNPGLLGTPEWFKKNFAIPIDKFGDVEKKERLKKLIYPFILRRTKQQVAKDLPEKVESTLVLEMGKKQRQIYDAYRNEFRDKVLDMIQEKGMAKAQMTVLQGLMKLRQICDSPAILKQEDFPNYSVKIDALADELSKNVNQHKILIFSQFLGMLSLLKEKLLQLNVPFEYFDGSTSVIEREKAIQRFQHNEKCRAFLISLKAGGVGLNLTAADYVYIVDPWWNPSVEQQAIDRTHRIGQTKNIFAYRMICKDTVEDKILALQEKKKMLSAEIIADEKGFVKKLTKDDIEYLFS